MAGLALIYKVGSAAVIWMRRWSFMLWLLALVSLTAGAHAETYPSRPVRLIVPFAAGGLNDVVARLVAPYLEKALGQPFIIDNPPDGYTLLMVASSYTVLPVTTPKLPYDPERDLAPIGMVAKGSLLFLVNPKVAA